MNVPIKTKVNRIGRVGQIIAILLIIAAAISFLVNAIFLIGRIITTINAAANPNTISIEDPLGFGIYVSTIGGMLTNIGYIVSYCSLKQVADELHRCDNPFENEIIRRMTVFGWMLFGVAVMSSFFSVLSGILLGSGLFILTYLLPSVSLVFSLILLFLTRVFRYGAELQKESDETL